MATGVVEPGSRKPMLAGSVSIAVHAAVIGLAIVLAGGAGKRHPGNGTSLTEVEIVAPLPAPLQAPPGPPTAVATPVVAPRPVIARPAEARTREPAKRSAPSAPTVRDALIETTVSYDDPSNFAGRNAGDAKREGDRDGRSSGIGLGAGVSGQTGGGVASMAIPAPSAVSLARKSRPKKDYSKMYLPDAARFAGQYIKVQLVIDTRGKVSEVRLLQGVDPELDRRTIQLVRAFEYTPALDEDGEPIASTSRWDIEVVDEDNDSFKHALERGHF